MLGCERDSRAAVRSCLGRRMEGGGGTSTSGESMHLPPQPPQTHITSLASFGWLPFLCPPRLSLPFSTAQSWPGWTHPWALCPPASVGFGQWREGSRGAREVRVFVLLLREGSPWTGSSLNQRSGGPVHTSLSFQVLPLLHALTCQAYRLCQDPPVRVLGNGTIPWASCTLRVAL